MDKKTIASMIDHAVLKPDATDEDIVRECATALKCQVASVCVKPCHVEQAYELLKNSIVKVCTVIGFPHGSTTTGCKVFEAIECIELGAMELDMVINIGKLLSGDFEYVENDIRQVANVVHKKGALLKVIIETSLLSDEMKTTACRLAEKAETDFVKTSTGFNGGGAAIRDIQIMKDSVGPKVRLKASGGIKTFGQAVEFARAGCSRLGTSNTESILSNEVRDKSPEY